MRNDLQLGSNHRYLAIYDPAALPPDTPVDPDLDSPEPRPLPGPAIRDLAAHGCALFLHIPEGDCDATVGVFVEEDLPELLRPRTTRLLTGSALSVPGGHLVAEGVEFMCLPGQTRRHGEPTPIEVPPADYSVEVLECVRWKERHRAAEVAARTTAGERLVGRLVAAYTLLGVLAFPANILVVPPALGLIWWRAGWQAALVTAGVIAAVDALGLVGFRLLDMAGRRLPVLRRAHELAAEVDRANPDLVLILRRAATPVAAAVPALAVLRGPDGKVRRTEAMAERPHPTARRR